MRPAVDGVRYVGGLAAVASPVVLLVTSLLQMVVSVGSPRWRCWCQCHRLPAAAAVVLPVVMLVAVIRTAVIRAAVIRTAVI